jgi:hypothetical protein
MKYYILQRKSYQLIRQPNHEFEEVFIGSTNEKKFKTKDQIIEHLKEIIVNEMFIVQGGNKFSKLILCNNDTGCVIESRYIIAHLAAMIIDRMFIKCTDIANPIIKSDLELDDLSVKDYVEIYRSLRLFIRSIKYKEDDRIVLCG